MSPVREYSCIYKHDSKDNKDNLMNGNIWIETVKEIHSNHLIRQKKGRVKKIRNEWFIVFQV